MSWDPRTTNDPVELESRGWMPGALFVPSPQRYAANTGVPYGEMYPRAIVHHVMVGYMGSARVMMEDEVVGDDADDYASWHFSIGRDGSVMQHESIWTPLWHAGLRTDQLTGEPVSELRRRYGYNPNAWTVGIEHEGFSVKTMTQDGRKRIDDYFYDSEHPWPEAMIAASIRVQRWIWKRCGWLLLLPRGHWQDANSADSRFILHSQIDPVSRANDPGQLWDQQVWPRIVNEVLSPEAEPRDEPFRVPAPPATTPAPPTPEPAPVAGYEDGRRSRGVEAIAAIRGLADALENQWT